jgi:hypothetical protein
MGVLGFGECNKPGCPLHGDKAEEFRVHQNNRRREQIDAEIVRLRKERDSL